MDAACGSCAGTGGPRTHRVSIEWVTDAGIPLVLADMQAVAVRTLGAVVGDRRGRILFGSRTGADGRTRWHATWWPEVTDAHAP